MPPSDPKSTETTTLGFDEFIGILVAFATMGAILFWSLSRQDSSWNLERLLLYPTPSTSPVPDAINQVSTKPPTASTFGVQPNVDSNLNAPPSPLPTPTDQPIDLSLPDEVTPNVVFPPFDSVVPNGISPVVIPVPTANATTQQQRAATATEKMPAIPPPIAFTDVPADFWARRFIDVLSSRGIIKGFADYSFRPNQPVSRAEFAAIMQQASDKKVSNAAVKLKDIPEKFWATSAIAQGLGKGFLKGYPDETFKPDQKISRVQVLVALVSGLNLKSRVASDQLINIYKDAQDIPNYATDKVAAATANRLVVNYPDTTILAPNKEATRAEVAAMVYQALVQMGKLEPIQSQNIVTAPR